MNPNQRGRAENPCATCVREGGPYRCCAHCADDAIHDVPENQHDLPCQTCLMDAEARGRAYMAAEIEALATVMQATSAPAPVIRALRALVADANPRHTPPRSVRIDEGLWRAAKAKAEERGETVTDVLVRALERYAKR